MGLWRISKTSIMRADTKCHEANLGHARGLKQAEG